MLEGILNDRALVPDAQPARPLEVIQKDRPRAVDTLFGIITVRRRYSYHTKARTGRCPLDEALDLVRGHTPGLARIICHASTHSSSFEEAAKSLRLYLGLRLAGRNFGRMIAELAPILREAQATLPAAKDEAPPILDISTDGTGVPLRRGELHGKKGRQPDGTARTREAKLGCVFIQATLEEEGHPVRDADSTTSIGTLENCHHHGPHLRAEALRRGSARAQQTRWCREMKQTSSAPILTQARAQLKAGCFIGSGVVEAGCKTVIGWRLKQSGMFWSQLGGDDLLALRCMTLGPNFTQIWNARLPILTARHSKPLADLTP